MTRSCIILYTCNNGSWIRGEIEWRYIHDSEHPELRCLGQRIEFIDSTQRDHEFGTEPFDEEFSSMRVAR